MLIVNFAPLHLASCHKVRASVERLRVTVHCTCTRTAASLKLFIFRKCWHCTVRKRRKWGKIVQLLASPGSWRCLGIPWSDGAQLRICRHEGQRSLRAAQLLRGLSSGTWRGASRNWHSGLGLRHAVAFLPGVEVWSAVQTRERLAFISIGLLEPP